MARTNKYTALNFNDIYEQKAKNHRRSSSFSSSSSNSSSTGNKTILSNSRIHGNMLVLSLPSPKPVVTPPPSSQPSPPLSPAAQPPVQPEDDAISLRPLGRTGSSPPLGQNKGLPVSPRSNSKFVPPHLRPGFHGREEKPGSNLRQGLGCDDGEEGRPKSGGGGGGGGGCERMNSVGFSRSRSIGSTRPSSSG